MQLSKLPAKSYISSPLLMIWFFFSFQLPLVFRVPRLYLSPLSVCFVQESLLGFGDVILPGEDFFYWFTLIIHSIGEHVLLQFKNL